MFCKGRNLESHCCYIAGEVCQYLEENTEPGFRWSCGLRRELGSWDAVIADCRYIPIAAALAINNTPNCADYPTPDSPCGACGAGHGDR